MIVISRNGRTVVVRGWRGWLVTAILALVAVVILVPVALIAFGLTVTIAVLLIFAIPLAVGFTLLAALWQRLPR